MPLFPSPLDPSKNLRRNIGEQVGDRLSVVSTSDSFRQRRGNVDGLEFGTKQLFVLVGDTVCDDNFRKRRVVDDIDGLARQDAC